MMIFSRSRRVTTNRAAFILLALLLITPAVQARDLKVKDTKLSFVMDAPLEKIKGATTSGDGTITIDEADLKGVKGALVIDLSQIKLNTFADEGKNATQTGHMLNWFEIGEDVDAATKEKFRKATLAINGAKLAIKKDSQTHLMLEGDLTLHGITKKLVIDLLVSKTDTGYAVKTAIPFNVNLEDYDIRPRDLAGKILTKTLEALGQKVAKDAMVSVDMTLE